VYMQVQDAFAADFSTEFSLRDLEWVWGCIPFAIWSGSGVYFWAVSVDSGADFGTSVGFSRWGSEQRHGLPPSSEVGLAWNRDPLRSSDEPVTARDTSHVVYRGQTALRPEEMHELLPVFDVMSTANSSPAAEGRSPPPVRCSEAKKDVTPGVLQFTGAFLQSSAAP
jgi:hypothetical protein